VRDADLDIGTNAEGDVAADMLPCVPKRKYLRWHDRCNASEVFSGGASRKNPDPRGESIE
jgi:hypothetical protein